MQEVIGLNKRHQQEQNNIVFPHNKLNLMPTCDDKLLWETWMSMFHFPTLTIADELGLFSLINQAPATASDVAISFGLGKRATEALLGVMTSLGYLVQHNGKFQLTGVSRNFLLPESPYYWGGMLKLMAKNPLSHSTLLEALKNDRSSVYQDQNVWVIHEIEPEKAKLFTGAMQSMTISCAVNAAKDGDFSGVKNLLDVGGGSAICSIALAQIYPQINFTILELPVICKIAEEYIAQAGLQNRIDTCKGDFFRDPFPSGYDAILFSNIFHDWGWEKCQLLAQRSFEALPKGGRIYLNEILLSDTKDSPMVATSFSMCMIWWTDGKQLTVAEVNELLQSVGFENISVTPTHSYYSLISAVKP
ncbi:methyltransferase [Iningainema tapete]|uniref:Ubiquinone/menaquinone biosynthesis protein n=1 Tax=Iningainema tapete BLCC-T55 TaxID=2748662 RepID=A0A8J6XSD8_9CYAN|nr:methyltransferase [Iningainema tapete]MBD2772768.1 ubiquinone/menaquinone biosynthesis protein [Iningainema tapete BLCC-T55]